MGPFGPEMRRSVVIIDIHPIAISYRCRRVCAAFSPCGMPVIHGLIQCRVGLRRVLVPDEVTIVMNNAIIQGVKFVDIPLIVVDSVHCPELRRVKFH